MSKAAPAPGDDRSRSRTDRLSKNCRDSPRTAPSGAAPTKTEIVSNDNRPNGVVGAHVFDSRDCGTLGALECNPGANNSTGRPAHLTLRGSASAGRDLLVVTATELPPGEPGLLLFGCNPGNGVLPGTLGTLCIDAPAAFTRLVVPESGHGTWRVELPLRATPLGSGFVTVRPGESWSFQLWYRDSGLPAKLSNAVRLTFS